MSLTRQQLVEAFPNQPLLVAQFEELQGLIDTAQSSLAQLNAAIAAAQQNIDNDARWQPVNSILTGVSEQNGQSGALELLGTDLVGVRPIDSVDAASLLTRGAANMLYAGGGGGGGGLAASVTFNAGGAGAGSGSSFNGSAPLTVSFNTVGAQAASALLSAYAGQPWSAGVQVPTLTAANTVALRTIGAAAASNLLDRAAGDGRYLQGNQVVTLTGDVTGNGATAIAATIANGAVSLAKMANVASGTVFYRKTAGAGTPEVQTLATLKTDLSLTGTNSGDQFTGMTSSRLLGRFTAGFGAAEEIALGSNVSIAGGTLNVTFGATAKLLGRTTAGAGNGEEIAVDPTLSLTAGTLKQAVYGAMVKKSADQVGADYSGGAAVAFDAEVYDIGGWHDNVTNNSRLTVPAGVAFVETGATITFGNVAVGTDMTGIIRKNGTTSYDGVPQDTKDAASASPIDLGSGSIPVVAGDYFELFVFAQTDTSIDVVAARTNFWIKAAG